MCRRCTEGPERRDEARRGCVRKEGELEHAIFFYKNFLRSTPNAPNRDVVTSWIEQLDKELALENQKEVDEAAAKRRVGAGVMTRTSAPQTSYVTDSATHVAEGTFATHPAVGVGNRVIPCLSVLLAPSVPVTPAYADHVSTQARVQILVGLQVHL